MCYKRCVYSLFLNCVYKEGLRSNALTFPVLRHQERLKSLKQLKKGVNKNMTEKANDVIFVGNKPPMSCTRHHNRVLFRTRERNNSKSPRTSNHHRC